MPKSWEENVCCAWMAGAMLSSSAAQQALQHFGSASAVCSAVQENMPVLKDLFSDPELRRLTESVSDQRLDFLRNALNSSRISVLSCLDEEYPRGLSDYDDPPYVLFYQGEIGCLKHGRTLSMVGSRRASYSGLQAAKEIAGELSRHHVQILSGLAYGIDAAAHQGCIAGGSPTVAVLGCGLDISYPSGNAQLRKDILQHGGLLITEFAPGDQPLGWHFPYRNRIISGLSRAVILMEAKIRSGSLTTVHHALNQGKEIFVYPGDPASEQFSGNRLLLREGARYFTTAEHILEDMNWLDNPAEVGQNTECAAPESSFTPAEKKILNVLKPGCRSFEQLCAQTGIAPPELMSTLTMLQIRGILEALPGKNYQIKVRS